MPSNSIPQPKVSPKSHTQLQENISSEAPPKDKHNNFNTTLAMTHTTNSAGETDTL